MRSMHPVHVKDCDVTQCCYNRDKTCHAVAIQVGDGDTPACDTYTPTGSHSCGLQETKADVGACKVSTCTYNQNMLCDAPQIHVGWKDNLAECTTFKKR